MSETQNENLNSLFAPSGNGLEPDILGVLESILRLYSITPQELFYKWESYCLKMGSEETKLDLGTARMFQKDVQDSLERSHQGRQSERKPTVSATPRTTGKSSDVYGMLDELTPNAGPRRMGSVKRKNDFDTPAPKRVAKSEKKANGPPSTGITFADRQNAGAVLETLNSQIPAVEPPIAPFAEPRVKLIANTDVKKFGYKPMSMRLTESSEVLDERIDGFQNLVQKHHKLEDNAFGNAAAQSTSEIVAVGRIACDTPEGKLNQASLLLELSRKWGGGLRVPLKVDTLPSYSFFPGQIVAVRGTNASGQYFQINEILTVPPPPLPVSAPAIIDAMNEKLGVSEESTGTPLNIMFASGPYTADNNLDFEPLQALCNKATEDMVDAMILTGPFLDIEHPMLASGDFDLPDVKGIDQDANTTTLFRLWISSQLDKVCSAVPSITIVLVPNVRDAISKHVSWPQEHIIRKELNLPKPVKMLPDPCFISLNEVVIGISSHDVLYQLSREQISQNNKTGLLERLPGYLIEQRHFFPLYPSLSRDKLSSDGVKATGDCIDLGYSKLGEWANVRPDLLLLPSMLTPSIKVVESVTVVNPGSLSKRKAAGTYAQMTLLPRSIADEERSQASIPHDIFERARVDVVRI
ncbi:DNA-directed DNA polymerase alpha subunit pol12 [Exophiala xenobiotica]|uniref:DNA polymerase alpha subunit B n=1 Tax=Lithohypha guttulata TaxID=1690604 RepID=A0ABR0KE51_9EURO|nr:DNA-directed DNA polymerase alpha subunit pol12 [Lithohypha guttulata]KAK5321475.1 DNA-directed DNA polymerase alpha subunit pol12 [Exophiala xenobiotica]